MLFSSPLLMISALSPPWTCARRVSVSRGAGQRRTREVCQNPSKPHGARDRDLHAVGTLRDDSGDEVFNLYRAINHVTSVGKQVDW